jgi:hypothetical protein
MQLNNDLNKMQIYCDESGFTGNRLLDADQPIFTFASVASNEEEAQFIVEKSSRIMEFKMVKLNREI